MRAARLEVELAMSRGPLAFRPAAVVEQLVRLDSRVVPYPHPAYPAVLRALEDAPPVLVVRGVPARLESLAVAIVGSRAATVAARRFTRRLAYDLARAGLTIVSGLARGIDAEAHRGALEAGGVTIGVLACGIDRIYPPEHRRLADEIGVKGAIVSELPLGALPRPLHFPLRNRIISGLSKAVVVVEARQRSGSLITVRHALAQGREVFVVPGPVDGPFAEGTNQLLREGARAIRCARDLLDDLGLEPVAPDELPGIARRARRAPDAAGAPGSLNSPRLLISPGSPNAPVAPVAPNAPNAPVEGGAAAGAPTATPLAERLARRLAQGARSADELLLDAGLDAGRLATALLELELAGRIVEERDGRWHLCRPPADRGRPGASLTCVPSQANLAAHEASRLDSILDGEATSNRDPTSSG